MVPSSCNTNARIIRGGFCLLISKFLTCDWLHWAYSFVTPSVLRPRRLLYQGEQLSCLQYGVLSPWVYIHSSNPFISSSCHFNMPTNWLTNGRTTSGSTVLLRRQILWSLNWSSFCEAQARVRQGSARDGSQGERPQSLNPCLELTLKLVVTHPPPPTTKSLILLN